LIPGRTARPRRADPRGDVCEESRATLAYVVQPVAAMNKPSWWNEKHDSTWDRIKSAMRRDWEQTKADVSGKGHDLNQGVGHTVKQAAGKEPIPPGDTPNLPKRSDKIESWEDVESSYRYGVGARSQYGMESPRWDDRLESKLSSEWDSLKDGRKWDEVKSSVRRAWDYGRK
jgi:hypothetical protein